MASVVGVADVVGATFGILQETMKTLNPTNTISLPMMPPFMPVGIVEVAQEGIRPQRRQRISMFQFLSKSHQGLPPLDLRQQPLVYPKRVILRDYSLTC